PLIGEAFTYASWRSLRSSAPSRSVPYHATTGATERAWCAISLKVFSTRPVAFFIVSYTAWTSGGTCSRSRYGSLAAIMSSSDLASVPLIPELPNVHRLPIGYCSIGKACAEPVRTVNRAEHLGFWLAGKPRPESGYGIS